MLSDKYDRKAVLFLFFLLFLGSCLAGCSFEFHGAGPGHARDG